MRYLERFIEPVKQEFRKYMCSHRLIERERKRFTAIYLSAQQRLSMSEIAESCLVSTNSVQTWFNSYQEGGFSALLDKNMAHHSSKLSKESSAIIEISVSKNPQNLQMVVADLSLNHQIQTNKRQLQNYLKKKTSHGVEYRNP